MKKLLLALALLALGLGPALAQDSPSDQNAGGGNDPPKQTGGGGGGGNKAQPGQEGNSGN
jgi:opacity protein-like surface antigen